MRSGAREVADDGAERGLAHGARRRERNLCPSGGGAPCTRARHAGGEGEIVAGHPAERLDRIRAEVGAAEGGVPGAEDQARNARELHGARAHRTGLHGGVHRGSSQARHTVLARRRASNSACQVTSRSVFCRFWPVASTTPSRTRIEPTGQSPRAKASSASRSAWSI